MEFHDSYYQWPHIGWWKQKEDIASKMTVAQLHFARLDCHKAALANPLSDLESKYRDEGCIYAKEMDSRRV